jgi:F-type H+-transporting ATPase subunit b
MKIDWFTLIAQVVNFLILVYLLKRFLYGRIVEAMDRREQRIADRMRHADEKEQKAQDADRTYEERTREFDEQRQARLRQVEAEAAARRDELFAQASREIDEDKARWQETLRKEQDTFMQVMKERIAQEVFAVSRRVLKDLGNASLQDRIIGVFLEKLAAVDRAGIIDWVHQANEPLFVCSAFPLSVTEQERITAAIRHLVSDRAQVRFGNAPSAGAGITLKYDGKKLGWTVESYLERFEQEMMPVLTRNPFDRIAVQKKEEDKIVSRA